MTLRTKPVRRSRQGWESGGRRNLYLNIGFSLAVIAALVILVATAGYTWYSDHYGTAATVDGATITKDALRQRIKIDTFRINYASNRVRTLQTEGRLTAGQASQQSSFLDQELSSVNSISLERCIDTDIQAKLAAHDGISVSEADVDAQLLKEATIPEQRHTWVIEVQPATDPATGVVTDALNAAAKQKAEQALADLKAGKKWEDVAAAVSSASNASQSGDLGYITADVTYDKPFLDAIFKTPKDGLTGVILGVDGTYRIGRVTDIAPQAVDATYQQKITDAGLSLADYRAAVRVDVVRIKLRDKVTADLSQPSLQRHVLEIHINEPSAAPPTDAIKVRHILFSPNHNPAGAASLPATDPAWAAAKSRADAAYAALQKNISQFDLLARTESDESAAKTTGGKLPYYDPTSQIDPAFAAAIFAKNLQPGQLLPPFKSSFGWHVVQIMYRPPDIAQMAVLKSEAQNGADFAQLARDNSEGPEAAKGGDIGWVTHDQLANALDKVIFAAPVGGISDPVVVTSDGVYLFKVLAEQMMTPTAEQLATLSSTGFSNWYAGQKAAAKITRVTNLATTSTTP